MVKPQSKFKYRKPEVWTGGYYDVEKELTVVSPNALEIVSDRSHIVLPTGIQPLGIESQKLEGDEINRAQIVIPGRIPGVKRVIRWESNEEETKELSEDYPHINPEDRKSTFSQRLMKIAEDWAKENSGKNLKLFTIENVYLAQEPVQINIHLSPDVLFGLMEEGLTLRERLDILHIPDGVLEAEIASFLRGITSEDVTLRTSKWHRKPDTLPTSLKGVTLHREPKDDGTATEFFLQSNRKNHKSR